MMNLHSLHFLSVNLAFLSFSILQNVEEHLYKLVPIMIFTDCLVLLLICPSGGTAIFCLTRAMLSVSM